MRVVRPAALVRARVRRARPGCCPRAAGWCRPRGRGLRPTSAGDDRRRQRPLRAEGPPRTSRHSCRRDRSTDGTGRAVRGRRGRASRAFAERSGRCAGRGAVAKATCAGRSYELLRIAEEATGLYRWHVTIAREGEAETVRLRQEASPDTLHPFGLGAGCATRSPKGRSVVPLAGIEPALLAELDFESSASTSSATGALGQPLTGRREAGGL